MNRVYFLNHSPITGCHFSKNSNDFVVSEVPLYEFSGDGEHLVLHVRKKDLTTWAMIEILARACGAKTRDFGYAGLKDKDGMTTQYISIHKSFEAKLDEFTHEKIKILSTTFHNNKIKMGHLKGNRFFIRLKKVLPTDAMKLKEALKTLKHSGFPNFFGYQRFGRDGENYKLGLEILSGKRREKNKKMSDFFISAFQSEIFNNWLNHRIELSKLVDGFDVKELMQIFSCTKEEAKELMAQEQFLKLFKGDVCHHYPHGRAFVCEDVEADSKRFAARDIVATGWLVGSRAMQCEGKAKEIEDKFALEALPYLDKMNGARRFAWSFLEDVEFKYREVDAWFEMNFTLQKGSYATVVLEEILKREILDKE